MAQTDRTAKLAPQQPETARVSTPAGSAAFEDSRPGALAQRRQIDAIERSSRHVAQRELIEAIHRSPRNVAQRERLVPAGGPVVQRRVVGKFGVEAEVLDGSFRIAAAKGTEGAKLLENDLIAFEEYEIAKLGGKVSVTLDGEQRREGDDHVSRTATVEYVQDAVDVDLESDEALDAVAMAWKHAHSFWSAHRGDTQSLKGPLGHWHQLSRRWVGDQFKDHTDLPGVSQEEGEKAGFDWTTEDYASGISTMTDDPALSVQATAGSTLAGLIEVCGEITEILRTGQPAMGENRDFLAQSRSNVQTKPETSEFNGMVYLLRKCVNGNGNTQEADERFYAKEYVSLMSRTSLDLVYGQLSAPARSLFERYVAEYFANPATSWLGKSFNGRGPAERVFERNAKKENQAASITIEDLLLSIIKKQRGDIEGTLVDSGEPVNGDAFVQAELAGLGEINPGAPEMIKKYGLDHAGEMLQGIPGLIFEARAAKSFTLSQMPELFVMLAKTLQGVNQTHAEFKRGQRSQQHQEEKQQRQQKQPRQPAKADSDNCFLTTACTAERGLPDDCKELQVLRAFRDNVLAGLPFGPELIACYYRQAPHIVATINAHEDRPGIYAGIYDAVRFCVDAIENGCYELALAAYGELVLRLELEFGESAPVERYTTAPSA